MLTILSLWLPKEARVREAIAFLTDLDADEQRWAADGGTAAEVENAVICCGPDQPTGDRAVPAGGCG